MIKDWLPAAINLREDSGWGLKQIRRKNHDQINRCRSKRLYLVEHPELMHWQKNTPVYTKSLLNCFPQIGKNTEKLLDLSEINKWLNTVMFY